MSALAYVLANTVHERLGYGGGFYDRTLAALQPRPFTVGVGYSHGFVPWLDPEPHDVPLDVMLTDEGAA